LEGFSLAIFKLSKIRAILKFAIGVLILAFVLFAATLDIIPIGGEHSVIRNNLEEKIDATPLFYSESEELPRLEAELKNK
jgi:hypothetical protein